MDANFKQKRTQLFDGNWTGNSGVNLSIHSRDVSLVIMVYLLVI